MIGKNRTLLLTLSGATMLFLLTGILMGRVMAREGNVYAYLKLFNEALNLIENNYVETVGEDRLLEGAYQGLFEELDPMSEFLTSRDYREIREDGSIPGTGNGLVLSRVRGYLSVVSVWPESPAAEAGILPGDQILRIGNRSTRGMSLVAASREFRGKEGASVLMLAMRPRWSAPREIEIKLGTPPPAWDARTLTGNVGYLRLLDLQDDTPARVEERLREFAGSGVSALVLDLRHNAGNRYPIALEVARLFMEPGPIAWLSGRDGKRTLWAEQERPPVWEGSLLVLVNRGTAAGGELIAAALQSSGRSELMGESTYGLGTHPTLFPLPDGAAVRLSTEKILPPDGEPWHGDGLEPDRRVAVDQTEKEMLRDAASILLEPAGDAVEQKEAA